MDAFGCDLNLMPEGGDAKVVRFKSLRRGVVYMANQRLVAGWESQAAPATEEREELVQRAFKNDTGTCRMVQPLLAPAEVYACKMVRASLIELKKQPIRSSSPSTIIASARTDLNLLNKHNERKQRINAV